MTRKRLILCTAAVLLILAASGGALAWALFQPPAFYVQAMQPPADPVRQKAEAEQLIRRTLGLVERIRSSEQEWSEGFSQKQINSWLAEELPVNFRRWLPQGVTDPRIRLSEDLIQVGFHLEQPKFSGVVSLHLVPWMVEPNQLAIEIKSIRAGLVPIPLDGVLRDVEHMIETDGWQIEWTQADGADVVLVRLGDDSSKEPVMRAIQVLDGQLRVYGTSGPEGSRIPRQIPRVADGSGASRKRNVHLD
jgi:hypothetical protein